MTRLTPYSLLLFVAIALFLFSPQNDNALVTFARADDATDESAVDLEDVSAPDGKCAAGKKCSSSSSSAETTDDDVTVDDEEDEDEDDGAAPPEEEKSEDKPAVIDPPGKEDDDSYTPPKASGYAFLETFQSKSLSQWTYTSADSYNGEFAVGQGKEPSLDGDRALIVPQKARKYGLSASIKGLKDVSKSTVVVQYEVKLEEGQTCSGNYVKLPLSGFDQKKFNGDTPYSIMFGPDKCGATNKVHFIFQSMHPETKERREHHLKDAPAVPMDTADVTTHLYTLIVDNQQEQFEILIDGESKKNGTLSEDFDPPVQMKEMIPDPEDKKPKDWVDEAKIPDPDAKKPDDWDEDAPVQIVDEDAVKPDDWLDDEPDKISDPDAKKPEEWDEEEDGEWEAPKIDNPKCEKVSGCGEWKKPMKKNPDYKGKWKAPMIDNPKYVGEWKPKDIENPDYYKVEKHSLLGIGGIAFELWTMDQAILFDNVWVGTNVEKAKEFAQETFMKKKEAEKAKAEKERQELEKQRKDMEKDEKTEDDAGDDEDESNEDGDNKDEL